MIEEEEIIIISASIVACIVIALAGIYSYIWF